MPKLDGIHALRIIKKLDRYLPAIAFSGNAGQDEISDVLEAGINTDSRFEAEFMPGLLDGVNMLHGEDLNLIPYYAWANREIGKMNVWFNQVN